MKLNILFSENSIEDLTDLIEIQFNCKIRVIREELSIFESYQIRPIGKFIPKIWTYRVIAKNGQYHFGTIS